MPRSRPKLSFDIVDTSFVFPADALVFNLSKPVGACWATDLHVLATNEELGQGYMDVNTLSNWYARVRELTRQATGVTVGNALYSSIINNGIVSGTTQGGAIGLLNGAYGSTYNIQKIAGSSGADFNLNTTNKFRPNWWAVHNFLQYGARCIVGVAGAGFTGELGPAGIVGNLSPLIIAADFGAPGFGYDIIFQSFHKDVTDSAGIGIWDGDTQTALQSQADVTTIVDLLKISEQPVLGIVNAGLTGNAESAAKISTLTDNEYIIRVAGDKKHLNSIATDTNASLIRTHLSPDVAGCIVNTRFPWVSPAGARRGRILNSVRLAQQFSTTAQDALYDKNVNPVIDVPGSGTLLYGDITNAADTSSLISINVIRTIIYIKGVLLPLASETLFEINDSGTRAEFKGRAESVLKRIAAGGGLTEYSVVCDESNNTQEVIDAKIFIADIKVKIPGSINYISITLTNE